MVVHANSVRVINRSMTKVLVTDKLEADFGQFWERNGRALGTAAAGTSTGTGTGNNGLALGLPSLRGRDLIIGSICPQIYSLVRPRHAPLHALFYSTNKNHVF
jgi:hypothetical protein